MQNSENIQLFFLRETGALVGLFFEKCFEFSIFFDFEGSIFLVTDFLGLFNASADIFNKVKTEVSSNDWY